MAAALELGSYRERAERFVEAIDREYYLHLAGRKPELELAPIYAEHSGLFDRAAIESLRELAVPSDGDEGRRLRYLLTFALDGMLGEATQAEAEEQARLEASLEIESGDERIPYRQVPVAQANEPDGERRHALEQARNRLLAERINPLHLAVLERSHRICRELGWASYADAYAELRGLDLSALRERTQRFIAATEAAYRPTVSPQLDRSGVPPFGHLRRSDLPRLLRAPELDAGFPGERAVPALTETLAGLGLDLDAQQQVHLDVEPRPSKSPRAFCSTPRVPDEVYLVVSPVGGYEDFGALFHEAGHAEHFAGMDRGLPFEFRHLGDNGVTESFAFLIEHLTEDPAWLRARLAISDATEIRSYTRAVRLMWIRRYCAKLAYELELHRGDPELESMPSFYATLQEQATGAAWTPETWLADVDEGFYVACYLRAWALEAHWRRALRDRWGERWFEQREAGAWLRGLWAGGQRLSAEELLGETLGEELDLGLVADDLLDRSARVG